MPIVTDLIVDQFGAFVSKHQGRLRVTQKERTLAEAPIMHLQRIVITGRGVGLSSDVIAACCQQGIPIHFLDSRGQPYAGLYSAGLTGTVLSRREQLAAYLDRRGLEVGRALAHAKIGNQAALLRYIAKYRKEADPPLHETLRIAAEADFLSVGTNDLVQYVLAADRNTEGLTGRLGLHPAMVRVLRHIAEGSSTAEREVSVCGELAGVSDLARLLVGLGFRSLSMAPRRSPAVRRTLCESDLAELEGIARRAVHCRNENEVSKLLGTLGSGLS